MPKDGTHRKALDQAAALEALIWSKGGVQTELPGMEARRFVGVVAAPDDREEAKPGRPPGAQNAVPEAFRRYLATRYGSAIEGLAHEATRPTVALVAELVDAWQTVCRALGLGEIKPTAAQVMGLVQMAKGLQVQAARYVAPYQHSQAPQPVALAAPSARIAVGLFTGGQPSEALKSVAEITLGQLLGIEQNQRVMEGEARELNADELNAERGA